MAFLIGGANTLDDSYTIDNSLKFNPGDNAYLNRTPGSEGNKRTFTLSFWAKISANYGTDTSTNNFFTARNSGGYTTGIQQISGGHIQAFIYDNTGGEEYKLQLKTNAVFRDVSAWYHIVFAVDTTQGTASNRGKLYVNGSQVTSFATETYPDQNFDSHINDDVPHYMGNKDGSNDDYDGYLADFYLIDGTQYAASNFGETDDNGVWIPKDAKGDLTFGTNGFFMEFQQTGTSANSSGKGADTSGQDNHYDDNNMTAEDITTDTPTNNFCTFNPLDVSGDENPAKVCTFSEGNTKVVQGNSNDVIGWAASTIGIRNGKWYFEIKLPTVGYQVFGIGPESWDGQDTASANVFMVYIDNGSATFRTGASGGQGSFSFSESNNDIWMFALDLDTPKLWFGVNGSWYNSGDPSAGNNPTSTQAITDTVFIKGSLYTQNRELLLNTGQPSFSISSGNSDANGHGNFEYAPPSGFLSICTKNLAETG